MIQPTYQPRGRARMVRSGWDLQRYLPDRLRDRRVVLAFLVAILVALLVAGFGFSRANAKAGEVSSARKDALAAATDAVPVLLTYDLASLKSDADKRERLLTKSFAADYQKLVSTKLQPQASKKQLVTQTQVATASTISTKGDDATILMFLNQASYAKGMDAPTSTGSRVRIEMKKVGGAWKVAGMAPF